MRAAISAGLTRIIFLLPLLNTLIYCMRRAFRQRSFSGCPTCRPAFLQLNKSFHLQSSPLKGHHPHLSIIYSNKPTLRLSERGALLYFFLFIEGPSDFFGKKLPHPLFPSEFVLKLKCIRNGKKRPVFFRTDKISIRPLSNILFFDFLC